eukprot:Gb_06166 [translate_table: standard]
MFKSSRLTTYTTVTVVRVASVTVDAPPGPFTNAPVPEKGYNFSLKFSDSQGRNFRAFGEDVGIHYDCRVDPSYIGYCKPWRDSVTGSLFCLFIPYTPEHLVQTLSGIKGRSQNFKVGDEYGILHISVIAVLRGTQEVSGSADVIFKGGFSILDMQEFRLTPSTNKSRITVVGSAGGVKLDWRAKDFMSVNRVSHRAMGVGGQAEYEVKALRQESFTDKLEITLPTTGQRMELDVCYEPGKLRGSPLSLEVVAIVILVSLVLLVLTIIIYLRLLDQPEPSRPVRLSSGTNPATEISTIPDGSPPRSTLLPADSLHTPPAHTFPRTPPQPFTEYIRRTVNDTPHFRRDGRRRFDPSYTY